MLALSTNDDEIDTDVDGGWANEYTGGSWENIWGGQ